MACQSAYTKASEKPTGGTRKWREAHRRKLAYGREYREKNGRRAPPR